MDSLNIDFAANGQDQLYWQTYNISNTASSWVTSGSSMNDIQTTLNGAIKFRVAAGQSYGASFDSIENLSLKASNSADLLIAQGMGSYDGKAGTDALYADWSSAANTILKIWGKATHKNSTLYA